MVMKIMYVIVKGADGKPRLSPVDMGADKSGNEASKYLAKLKALDKMENLITSDQLQCLLVEKHVYCTIWKSFHLSTTFTTNVFWICSKHAFQQTSVGTYEEYITRCSAIARKFKGRLSMLDIMELDPATFNLINKISYEEASRASSADVEEELEEALT
jgi:hypothetical protein